MSSPIPSTWGILKWTPKSKKEEKTVLDLGLTLKPQHMIINIVQGVFLTIFIYRLILGLLRFFRASMWPQDWAQITFRSEILSNQFKNKSRSCLPKGRISWFVVLRMKFMVAQNSFLLHLLNFEYHRLKNITFLEVLLGINLESMNLKS